MGLVMASAKGPKSSGVRTALADQSTKPWWPIQKWCCHHPEAPERENEAMYRSWKLWTCRITYLFISDSFNLASHLMMLDICVSLWILHKIIVRWPSFVYMMICVWVCRYLVVDTGTVTHSDSFRTPHQVASIFAGPWDFLRINQIPLHPTPAHLHANHVPSWLPKLELVWLYRYTGVRLQSLSSLMSSTSSLINCDIMQPWVSTKTLDSMASRLLEGPMEQRQVGFYA